METVCCRMCGVVWCDMVCAIWCVWCCHFLCSGSGLDLVRESLLPVTISLSHSLYLPPSLPPSLFPHPSLSIPLPPSPLPAPPSLPSVMRYIEPPTQILRYALMKGLRYPLFAQHIGAFIATTLYKSSALALDGGEGRQDVFMYLCVLIYLICFCLCFYCQRES